MSTASTASEKVVDFQIQPLQGDHRGRRSGPQNSPGLTPPFLTRRRSSVQLRPDHMVMLRNRRKSVAVLQPAFGEMNATRPVLKSRRSSSGGSKMLSIPLHFQRRKSRKTIGNVFKVGTIKLSAV